ncbi:MAG: AEC family transporter [Eubacterium sp.]|nr:AEC family transporter [Candidatus Colimonas fimequi]
MENSLIIFTKLVVMFAFALAGYIAFKKHWVTDKGSSEVSKLIVNIFNPALIIATVVGADERPSAELVMQNVILVCILFGTMIALSPIIARVLRVPKDERTLYMIMLVFTNLGFMGIPLIGSLYGQSATFYVSLYILMYNLLFYSFGLYLFKRQMNTAGKFSIKQMCNPGMFACLVALFFFLVPIQLPFVAIDFISYLADACVPLSMIVTGFALAHINLKEIFTEARLYGYVFIKQLFLPIVAALIIMHLPGVNLNPVVAGILPLMYGMPNGSMPVIVSEEYGMDNTACSKLYALTTLVTIVTLPIVTLFV